MATTHIVLDARPLTAAEMVEARALRDELMADRDLAVDFYGAAAGRQARAQVRELLDFAAEWDAMAGAAAAEVAEVADLMARAEAGQLADDLAALLLLESDPTPAPAPEAAPVAEQAPAGARERAAAKAAYHLAGGLELRRVGEAYLVPSGTRGGTIHRVEGGVCSCEAAQRGGRPCWHVEAVAQVEAGALAPMAA